jgi:hypothetical protein
MNILTDRLPRAIRIGEKVYPVNSDFRDCLRIILAFEDNDLTWVEKQIVMLTNLYAELPDEEHIEEALLKGVKFLNGGEDDTGEQEKGSNLRLYSFSKDARYIFAAFQQTHGIDLQNTEYLHWWQFMTLFMDLGSETMFCNLIGLRKRVKTGKASKEEKQVAQEMGNIFDVPEVDTRTLNEKERDRDFLHKVAEARKRKKEQMR